VGSSKKKKKRRLQILLKRLRKFMDRERGYDRDRDRGFQGDRHRDSQRELRENDRGGRGHERERGVERGERIEWRADPRIDHDRERDRERELRERERFDVDRSRTCPFLIRTFAAPRDHAPPHAYHGMDGVPNDPLCEEVDIYTWGDASLLELAELVRDRVEGARKKVVYDPHSGKRFPDLHFCCVYPDREGRYSVKPMGWVKDIKGAGEGDERRSISSLGFQVG